MTSDGAWGAARDRLQKAVRQELAAVSESRARGGATKARPVGKAAPNPLESGPVQATFSVDLRRRALRDDQLEDAFLATDANAPTTYPVLEVVACKPAEVIVRTDPSARSVEGLQLFIISDPTALLRGLHDALAAASDGRLVVDLERRQLTSTLAELPERAAALNPEQQQALRESLAPGVNVVWGPPGTGKTSLLGTFLAEVVATGRSALLLSNTNTAVDEALLRTNDLLGDAPVGQIVRAGIPSDLRVVQHPHLALDKAAKITAAELTSQLEQLDRQIAADAAEVEQRLTAGHVATAALEAFPAPDELAEMRRRCDVAVTSGRRAHDALDEASVCAHEVTAAEDVLTARVARVEELYAVLQERRVSEDARTALALLRREQVDHEVELAVAAGNVQIAEQEHQRAEASLGTAERKLWGRAAAVNAARSRIATATTTLAEAIRQHDEAARSLPDRSAEAQALVDVATRFTPAEVATAHAEHAQAETGRQAARQRLDRARAARAVSAAAYGDARRAASAAAQLAADAPAVVAAADAAGYDELLRAVEASRRVETEHAERRSAQLAERKQVLDAIARQHPELIANCSLLAATTAALAATAALAPARDRVWDYVIIDEASACLYPYLAYAATRASHGVTIVGDFRQNGPISAAAQRPDSRAVAALSQDVFEHLGIGMSSSRPGLTMLSTQYRFPAPIAAVANRFGYNGRLTTVHAGPNVTFDGLPSAPLLLLDVSGLPEDFRWVSTPPGASKKGSWLAGALAALELAERVPPARPDGKPTTFGVVTAYSEQAALTSAALAQHRLPGECGTSHRYQGREFDLVVFDTTEPTGHRGWAYASSFSAQGWAFSGARLCNVAMTRCRSQVAVIIDGPAVRGARTGFLSELRLAVEERRAAVVDVAALVRQRRSGPESWSLNRTVPASTSTPQRQTGEASLVTSPTPPPAYSDGAQADTDARPGAAFLTEVEMYEQLPAILRSARRSVEIWSAFVARTRLEATLPLLAETAGRGVTVRVHCKPPSEVSDGHTNSGALLTRLRAAGADVHTDFGAHEKALLVDDHDGYYGSLNLLSHRNTTELMIHLRGEEQARAFKAAVGSRTRPRTRGRGAVPAATGSRQGVKPLGAGVPRSAHAPAPAPASTSSTLSPPPAHGSPDGSELVATRWQRFGHDRLYVQLGSDRVGWVDLRSGTETLERADLAGPFRAAVQDWRDRNGPAPVAAR